MRDPERIPEILERIRKVWSQAPDLRLGQMIVNAAGRDPFYVEDEDMAQAIERMGKKKT